MADYNHIKTECKSDVKAKEKISALAKKLPNTFLRIHRSFIINTDKVNHFGNDTILVAGKEFRVERSYKQKTAEFMLSLSTTST